MNSEQLEAIKELIRSLDNIGGTAWWSGDDYRQTLDSGVYHLVAWIEAQGGYRASYQKHGNRGVRSTRVYNTMLAAKHVAVSAAVHAAWKECGATADWRNEIDRGFFGAGS